MDSGIQGALSILSTIAGPSPVLDGLIDQIVATGLPMVPALVAAASAAAAAAAGAGAPPTPAADTTARMLLSGMQRASEFVSSERKVAIVKGIATHVCPSAVLPWAVRAFAVKVLHSIFQQHFANVAVEPRAEAVAAAADAMAHIVQSAHSAELARFLKVPGSDEAAAPHTHPYHNAEIKSAAEFFALLTETDADAVASVYAPRLKAHSAAIAAVVAAASVENSAAASVAQAVHPRFDLAALGLPRTAALRGALEKLNCVVLIEIGQRLAEGSATAAFDAVLGAYPLFFGRGAQRQSATAANNNNSKAEAATVAAVANAEDDAAPAAEEAEEEKAAGEAKEKKEEATLGETLRGLVRDHSVSNDTITTFLKTQLKDSLARVAATDLPAVSITAAADTSSSASDAVVAEWAGRLTALSRAGIIAKPSMPMASSLAEFTYGLLRIASLAAAAGHQTDVLLTFVRDIERFIHRSVSPVALSAAPAAAAAIVESSAPSSSTAVDPSEAAAAASGVTFPTTNAGPIHTRFIDGLALLLRALLPAEPLATDAEANASLNAPLLEVAAMLLVYLSPRPYRYVVPSAEAAVAAAEQKSDDAAEGEESGVAKKRTREEDGEEEGEENAAASDAEEEDAEAAAATTSAAAATASAAPTVARYHYYNDAQRHFATVVRGGFLSALQAALRVTNDDINTIEVAKRLRTLMGDKAPAEVAAALADETSTAAAAGSDNADSAAAAPTSAFVPHATLLYRQRVLQNIIAVFRLQCGGRNVAFSSASYATSSPSQHGHKGGHHSEGGHDDRNAHHSHHRGGPNHRAGGGNNNRAAQHHNHRADGRNGGDNTKRARFEDSRHANNNNSSSGGSFPAASRGGNHNNNSHNHGRHNNNNNNHNNNGGRHNGGGYRGDNNRRGGDRNRR